MEVMNQQRVTLEEFLVDALTDWLDKALEKDDDTSWWSCVSGIISIPFYLLALLLMFTLGLILVCLRLAVTHADRVVFVLASALLSFYQVPRKVFYIYIAVLASTGFLQCLRYRSDVRDLFLGLLSCISCGTSSMFLRKFTTLHFSNPFNRRWTESKVIYVPIGLEIPSLGDIEVFDFLVSDDLNFDKIVGDCKIKIETLDNSTGSNTLRVLYVEAPWGQSRFTVNMENNNLGRLISYFNRVIETNCKELISTVNIQNDDLEALSIYGAVKHFNSGLRLVKLEIRSLGKYGIF